jgi:ADP-ribose pyrophosphatase YjhB (NUDIX family)
LIKILALGINTYSQNKKIPKINIDNALLLLRTKNEPAKGEWWFPGGRIKKGESLEQASHREVKDFKLAPINSSMYIQGFSLSDMTLQ